MNREELILANRQLSDLLNQLHPAAGISLMLTQVVLWGRINQKTRAQYFDIVMEIWDEVNNLLDIEARKNSQRIE